MELSCEDFFKKLKECIDCRESYPRFVCDSRQVKEGDVFVALKGETFDGHQFVQTALEKKAVMAIVNSRFLSTDGRVINVNDPLDYIKKLALYKLQKIRPKTIGITGSCGKTTTKRFLETILSEQGPVFATFGNFNSQIGIPLALCSLHEMQKTAIIEMGMSHAGDIKKLVDWIYLDFAIITSIGLSHAENFVDKDHGIAKAKAEILTHNPLGFFNEKTNLYQPFQTIACKQILKTTEISVSDQGVSFKIFDEVKGPFKTNIQASHLLENLHLALACSYKLGLCNEKIQAALLKLDVEPQRMQELKKQNIDFIDDSYNASPSSMREAVYYLKSKKAKRKIAVIGAMKELGLLSLKEHDHLGDLLIQDVDFVYLLGDETAIISEKIPQRSKHFSKLDDLKTDLESFLQEGDLVLVKGSHSTHLHTLVNSINLR